ncbi:hypothetical protein HNP38_002199 [Chryseobacterium defluvii]|uniref:Uncharacterized protein n=1 Tax=Chryseobacterium defluvii TaxID=160396 RepID=A0A840KHB0_9FLAO|nr:hypothetical protein [Chryseobacterium defluvii]MBB4806903.1 hypothetical protein [Chryseobacterium defluvii]
MYRQIINTENKKIEIQKYLKDPGFLGLGFLFGDYKLHETITFDFEKKKIVNKGKSKTTEIPFQEITSIWVHQAQFMEGDELDYRVGVFVKTGDFHSLYVFFEPHFGRNLFDRIEREITGGNEPFRIRKFQELQKRIANKEHY